jgi:hypothetical protein
MGGDLTLIGAPALVAWAKPGFFIIETGKTLSPISFQWNYPVLGFLSIKLMIKPKS